jgi:hypothetical protein
MKKKIKPIWIIIFSIIIILAITNPGTKRFKDYIGTSTYAGLSRQQNWILFSIYIYRQKNTRYIGIFMNFFQFN